MSIPKKLTTPECLELLKASEGKAKMRLIFFPFLGGSAFSLQSLAKTMPDWIECWGVNLPGRGSRVTEEPWTDLQACVRALAEDFKRWVREIKSPCAFFGHSMGTHICHEFIRYMYKRFKWSPCAFIAAGNHPSVKHLREKYEEECPPYYKYEDDDELIADMKRLGGLPEALLEDEASLHDQLKIYKADSELLDVESELKPLMHCPLFAYWGNQEEHLEHSDMEFWSETTENRKVWANREYEADHFFILDEDVLEEVSQDLEEDLENAFYEFRLERATRHKNKMDALRNQAQDIWDTKLAEYEAHPIPPCEIKNKITEIHVKYADETLPLKVPSTMTWEVFRRRVGSKLFPDLKDVSENLKFTWTANGSAHNDRKSTCGDFIDGCKVRVKAPTA